jgi:hypothetical protein
MILLLGVMVLNIGRYQLPHIEYKLFRDYIVETLCIQRTEVNNECQGKCFLHKQIDLVNESGSAGNPAEKESITFETDDYVMTDATGNELHFGSKTHTPLFLINIYVSISVDIPAPPPKRLA